MSLSKLTQTVCVNYHCGKCLGIIIRSDLSQYVDASMVGKSCCVRDCRCDYFEAFVIPAVRQMRSTDPLKQSYEKAVYKYESKTLYSTSVSEKNSNMPKKIPRRCRQCKKPVFGMKPNEKFCPACKEKRINESKRRSYRVRLEKVRQLSLTI